jgi:hypothetical protein
MQKGTYGEIGGGLHRRAAARGARPAKCEVRRRRVVFIDSREKAGVAHAKSRARPAAY